MPAGSPYFSTGSGPATGLEDGGFDFSSDEGAISFDDNHDGDPGDVMAASGGLGLNCPAGLSINVEDPADGPASGALPGAGWNF